MESYDKANFNLFLLSTALVYREPLTMPMAASSGG